MDEPWECVVVGGGAAGLSAALVLGRARRRTLVVDAGAQSNRSAHGIGGLVGHDGRSPGEYYAACRRDIAAYPTVRIVEGEVVRGEPTDRGAALVLADGSSVGAAGAPGDGDGVPTARPAGRGVPLGEVGVPLSVLSRVGAARPAARSVRRWRAQCGAGYVASDVER